MGRSYHFGRPAHAHRRGIITTSGTIPNTKGAAARGSPSSKPSPAEKGDHEVVDEEIAIHDYFTSSNHKRVAISNPLTSFNTKRDLSLHNNRKYAIQLQQKTCPQRARAPKKHDTRGKTPLVRFSKEVARDGT